MTVKMDRKLEGNNVMNCDKCAPGFNRRNFLRFSLAGAGGAVASSLPHKLLANRLWMGTGCMH